MVKLFIGNLSDDVSSSELKDLFGKYGTVTECDVVTGKGFGFIHYDDERDAEEAVSEMKHYELAGRRINVEMARQGTDRGGPRGGGGSGCFSCGEDGHFSRECPNRGGGGGGGGGGRGCFSCGEDGHFSRECPNRGGGGGGGRGGGGGGRGCYNCGEDGHMARDCRGGGGRWGDRGGGGGYGGGRDRDSYGGGRDRDSYGGGRDRDSYGGGRDRDSHGGGRDRRDSPPRRDRGSPRYDDYRRSSRSRSPDDRRRERR